MIRHEVAVSRKRALVRAYTRRTCGCQARPRDPRISAGLEVRA